MSAGWLAGQAGGQAGREEERALLSSCPVDCRCPAEQVCCLFNSSCLGVGMAWQGGLPPTQRLLMRSLSTPPCSGPRPTHGCCSVVNSWPAAVALRVPSASSAVASTV